MRPAQAKRLGFAAFQRHALGLIAAVRKLERAQQEERWPETFIAAWEQVRLEMENISARHGPACADAFNEGFIEGLIEWNSKLAETHH